MEENTLLIKLLQDNRWNDFEKKFDELKKDSSFDFFIKGITGNYLIYYAIMYNHLPSLKKILETECILDILDSDGRSILYLPIKHQYHNILEILIKKNEESIGVSIIDIIDKHNDNPLNYCIEYNNYEALETLIKNNAILTKKDKQGNTLLHQIVISWINSNVIINKKKQIFENILNLRKINIDNTNIYGMTILHYAVNLNYYDLAKLLLENGANANIIDYEEEITPLFYAIKSKELISLLLNFKGNVNIQDHIGNTILHYCIYKKYFNILDIIFEKRFLIINKSDEKYDEYKIINPNVVNINGMSFLHLLLFMSPQINTESTIDNDIILKYAKLILPYIKINLQDNKGKSILVYLILTGLWKNVDLKNKKLDIYLKDNSGKRVIDYVQDTDRDSFIEKIFESKKLLKKEIKNINILTEYIANSKQIYIEEEILNIVINKDVLFTTFTGIIIDILSGLIYLKNKYDTCFLPISKTFNKSTLIENYYIANGVYINNNYSYTNFDIQWIYQKIFYPDNFDKLLATDKRITIIPLAIELKLGSHANYLIYDKKLNEMERFEPAGSTYPYKFNYNPDVLDNILEAYFTVIYGKSFKYFKPSDYLPKIGFQSIDRYENNNYKKIGDPGGFCALWCIWYADMRISNIHLSRNSLVDKLMEHFKQYNISIKNMIRNYSTEIIKMRDSVLEKAGTDINSWINEVVPKDGTDKVFLSFSKMLHN